MYTSEEELIERMQRRGDSEDTINQRVFNDIKEFANIDSLADYITENVNIKDTVDYIYDIWVDHSFDLTRGKKD